MGHYGPLSRIPEQFLRLLEAQRQIVSLYWTRSYIWSPKRPSLRCRVRSGPQVWWMISLCSTVNSSAADCKSASGSPSYTSRPTRPTLPCWGSSGPQVSWMTSLDWTVNSSAADYESAYGTRSYTWSPTRSDCPCGASSRPQLNWIPSDAH